MPKKVRFWEVNLGRNFTWIFVLSKFISGRRYGSYAGFVDPQTFDAASSESRVHGHKLYIALTMSDVCVVTYCLNVNIEM